jgi:hypothetical protein
MLFKTGAVIAFRNGALFGCATPHLIGYWQKADLPRCLLFVCSSGLSGGANCFGQRLLLTYADASPIQQSCRGRLDCRFVLIEYAH